MYMYLLYSLCYAQIMSCLICFTMKYNFLGVNIVYCLLFIMFDSNMHIVNKKIGDLEH